MGGSAISSGFYSPPGGLTAQNFSDVDMLVIAVVSVLGLSGLVFACQPTSLWTPFDEGAPDDERNGTHGDSGAGLKPPSVAKLRTLRFSL